MRRLFWIALGAGVGVYVARRVRHTAQQLTPESVANRVLDRSQGFWSDVQRYTADREAELRDAFGLDERPER